MNRFDGTVNDPDVTFKDSSTLHAVASDGDQVDVGGADIQNLVQ